MSQDAGKHGLTWLDVARLRRVNVMAVSGIKTGMVALLNDDEGQGRHGFHAVRLCPILLHDLQNT